MLDRYALLFTDAMGLLASIEPAWRKQSVLSSMSGSEEERKAFRENRLSLTQEALRQTRDACAAAGLTQVFDEIGRVESAITSPFPFLDDHSQSLRHLHSRVRDELQSEYFAHVARTDVGLFNQKEPFGTAVSKKLPKASEDIECAGKCLALEQYTAAVFHLMRAMEVGVRRLGTRLKVSINVNTETWYQILQHVDGKIKKLPVDSEANKNRKAKLAAASQYLDAVRIAVRNEVMHPKQTYRPEEAREVYAATRAFMGQLAKLL
jgi:hypothetical protein